MPTCMMKQCGPCLTVVSVDVVNRGRFELHHGRRGASRSVAGSTGAVTLQLALVCKKDEEHQQGGEQRRAVQLGK
jgi:hypothetical protein